MTDYKNTISIPDELKRITSVMLEKESSPIELRQASWDLFNLCSGITGIQEKSQAPEDHSPIYLQSGKAIAPIDAAKCLQDFARTVMFMRGTYEGIIEAQKRFPGEKITILYAGCGPFIPFMLGMAAKFSANQIDFILIDIHQRALDAAAKIIETLDLKEYIKDCVLADASKYIMPQNIKAHILIIEAVNMALSKEPQASITSNLASQICKNGILIPEEITVTACMADPYKEFKTYSNEEEYNQAVITRDFRERKNPLKIFEISLKKIPRVKKLTAVKTEVLVKPTALYKAEVPASGNYCLMLCTKIRTFGDNLLSDYDSILSMPFQIDNLLTAGSTSFIEFSYWAGKVPGFKYRLVTKRRYLVKQSIERLIKILFKSN